MNDLQLLILGGELTYTFDFSAEVPSTSPETTVSSVAYTVPSQLTSVSTSDDLANKRSSILLKPHVDNGKHGQTVQVKAVATLSNNEKVPKLLTVRLTGS